MGACGGAEGQTLQRWAEGQTLLVARLLWLESGGNPGGQTLQGIGCIKKGLRRESFLKVEMVGTVRFELTTP